MSLCSSKVTFLRVRKLALLFCLCAILWVKSTWEEASPKVEETGQVMHPLLAPSLHSLGPFYMGVQKETDELCILLAPSLHSLLLSHGCTCSPPSFPSRLLWVTQPWASSLHNLSRSLPPHPKPVGLSHFKYSFSWVSCSFIHSHNLVSGGPCSLYFNLDLKMLHFFRVHVGLPLKEILFCLRLIFLSLRWKQPLFFLIIFSFQLSFHLLYSSYISQ